MFQSCDAQCSTHKRADEWSKNAPNTCTHGTCANPHTPVLRGEDLSRVDIHNGKGSSNSKFTHQTQGNYQPFNFCHKNGKRIVESGPNVTPTQNAAGALKNGGLIVEH